MEALTHQIIELLNQGKSYREIQKILDVHPNKISEVKKLYPGLINISESRDYSDISANSISALAIDRGIKSDEIEAYFSSSGKNSANSAIDPETLKELKQMQYSHVEKVKKMEYEDKEKDRNFKRENDEKLRREKLEVEEKDETINKLRREVWETRDENEKLKKEKEPENDEHEEEENEEYEEDYEDENDPEETEEDEEEEPFDPEFDDDMTKFVENTLLAKDGDRLDENEVKEVLSSIRKLKSRFKKICDYDGDDHKDFNEWEILTSVEKYLKNKSKEFGFWTSRIDFTIDKEWKKFLEEFLQNE